jgi:hypothetical protein
VRAGRDRGAEPIGLGAVDHRVDGEDVAGRSGGDVDRRVAEALRDELDELGGLEDRHLRGAARGRGLVHVLRDRGFVDQPVGSLRGEERVGRAVVRNVELRADLARVRATTLGDSRILGDEHRLRPERGRELVHDHQFLADDRDVGGVGRSGADDHPESHCEHD